jgi:hypothetical protein
MCQHALFIISIAWVIACGVLIFYDPDKYTAYTNVISATCGFWLKTLILKVNHNNARVNVTATPKGLIRARMQEQLHALQGDELGHCLADAADIHLMRESELKHMARYESMENSQGFEESVCSIGELKKWREDWGLSQERKNVHG